MSDMFEPGEIHLHRFYLQSLSCYVYLRNWEATYRPTHMMPMSTTYPQLPSRTLFPRENLQSDVTVASTMRWIANCNTARTRLFAAPSEHLFEALAETNTSH
jgi:hypothetical protein